MIQANAATESFIFKWRYNVSTSGRLESQRKAIRLPSVVIRFLQDDSVAYRTKDGIAHEFDALEFLAELSCHIPKTYESITRYYGRYS